MLPDGNLWLTGGFGNDDLPLNSTEIVDSDLKIRPGPDLPYPDYDHCMVQWNETHTMFTGGFQDPTSVRFYDWSTEAWFDGKVKGYTVK